MDQRLQWLELADLRNDYWRGEAPASPPPLLITREGDPLGWIGLPHGCVHLDLAALRQGIAGQLDYPLLRCVGERWIGGAPRRPGCRDVSVAVLVRHGGALLRRCLDALARQGLAPSEVLLVGAQADTPPPQVNNECQWLGGASGPAAARNRAWRAAHAKVVAFLDESTRPAPGWLEHLGATFEPETAAAGGPVLAEGISVPHQAWYEQFRDGAARGLERFHVDGSHASPTQLLWGTYLDKRNLAVRRETLVSLRGFDESLDRFGDESVRDLIYRLLSDGECLSYEPAALVAYVPPSGPATLRRHALNTGRGFAAYLRRRRSTLTPRRLLRFMLNHWWRRRLLARLLHPAGLPRSLILLEIAGALWPAREGRRGRFRPAPDSAAAAGIRGVSP